MPRMRFARREAIPARRTRRLCPAPGKIPPPGGKTFCRGPARRPALYIGSNPVPEGWAAMGPPFAWGKTQTARTGLTQVDRPDAGTLLVFIQAGKTARFRPPRHWRTDILNRPAIALLATLSIVIAASPRIVAADAVEAPGNILATARVFLEEQLAAQDARTELRLGGVDTRLRLPACDLPLQGFLPPGGKLGGNTSVGVECRGTRPWKLYVQAYVGMFRTVAVASGYLAAGTVLNADNVRMEERDVTASGYGYLTDLEPLQGMIVKQPLQDGRVIPPQAVGKARLIRRGDSVVLLSRNGGIEVRMNGSAMMDGTEGDRIKVRNAKSKRVVEGRVEAPGLVMVSM